MPTLLQLNCASNWGSTGKIAEQIGLCAQTHGWKCYIAFGRSANHSALTNIKVGNMLWTLEHFVENRFLDNEGLASRIPTKRLLKEIDKIHPDVVHLHNIHDHWLNYRILFEYLVEKQIPVVWTQHDQWATTGHCYYNLIGCKRWKTECHDCPMSKWYSLDRSRRNFNLKKNLCAGLKSLAIVPVSEWLADNMRQSHLKNRPIEVIHNGIDINVFKPVVGTPIRDKRIEEKKILLAVASVWSDAKGLSDYIKLSEILPYDYVIMLVGLTESQITSLPQKIVGLLRTQNVTDLVQLYSMAHIVMSLSYSETFGLSIVEGMACGTPAIVYDNTAQKYLIDEHTGLAIETGDVAGVAEAVKELDASIEANKEEISADCRRRASEYYDKNKNYQSYISLYNKLLGGEEFIILGVSSVWSKDKGLYDFIELSKNLDFIVLLVGLKQEQVDMFNSPKYKDCNIVPVCRTQNQQELAMLYSMADVFVNPTYADMFPTVNLEALATTIREFRDTDFKKHHSADCRKRAEECFGKYVKLYERLLKS